MNNVLITKTGKVIDCSGTPHENVCRRQLHTTLDDFLLAKQGVRVKIHFDEIAVEYYKQPNTQQTAQINKILRDGEYYVLVTTQKGRIEKFRPIKRFTLN